MYGAPMRQCWRIPTSASPAFVRSTGNCCRGRARCSSVCSRGGARPSASTFVLKSWLALLDIDVVLRHLLVHDGEELANKSSERRPVDLLHRVVREAVHLVVLDVQD